MKTQLRIVQPGERTKRTQETTQDKYLYQLALKYPLVGRIDWSQEKQWNARFHLPCGSKYTVWLYGDNFHIKATSDKSLEDAFLALL